MSKEAQSIFKADCIFLKNFPLARKLLEKLICEKVPYPFMNNSLRVIYQNSGMQIRIINTVSNHFSDILIDSFGERATTYHNHCFKEGKISKRILNLIRSF